MLELRPNCECCDQDLPADSRDAMICTFECTFLPQLCNDSISWGLPQLQRQPGARPVRPAALLKVPAATERVVKPGGCSRPHFDLTTFSPRARL